MTDKNDTAGGSITKKVTPVVCQSCRARHLKCDKKLPSCSRCQELSLECIRSASIRFRNVDTAVFGTDLTFDESQVWVTPRTGFRFYDETADVAMEYEKEISWEATNSRPLIMETERLFMESQSNPPESMIATRNSQVAQSYTSTPAHTHSDTSAGFGSPSNARMQTARQRLGPEVCGEVYFESPTSVDSYNRSNTSHLATVLYIEPLSEREAVLMRNFIENMALWADATDEHRHFEVDVPRRALQQPVLRFAIFAFSSRHLNRQSDQGEREALYYHNKCLELLIPALSEASSTISEDILAAVAILRQYEEMDDIDQRCHLLGTSRILNSVSTFGSSGGLGEAAAWLCLRQDIYISLVSQQPLVTNLENFRGSSIFRSRDDIHVANQMVFLLAKVLSCACGATSNPDESTLQDLKDEVVLWFYSKPIGFEPLRTIPRNREAGVYLPEIWLLSAFHVVGWQYYHIAKLVLAVSMRRPTTSGYEDLRHARKVEKVVRHHLLMVLGLAVSNKKAENTLFTARHTLSVWGGILRGKDDREAAVSFLVDMQQRTGWSTIELVVSLKEQWAEDSDEN